MPEKRKPNGFVATCQCGRVVGAMDYTRTDRAEAGKLLGGWLADGCTVAPQFNGSWRVTVEPCDCDDPAVLPLDLARDRMWAEHGIPGA